jgi:hypothetical protein
MIRCATYLQCLPEPIASFQPKQFLSDPFAIAEALRENFQSGGAPAVVALLRSIRLNEGIVVQLHQEIASPLLEARSE